VLAWPLAKFWESALVLTVTIALRSISHSYLKVAKADPPGECRWHPGHGACTPAHGRLIRARLPGHESCASEHSLHSGRLFYEI
jgi:hypothetical protein